MAFQVRWQDNNIEWYTENPAGEDLVGEFWGESTLPVAGFSGCVIKAPGYWTTEYYMSSALIIPEVNPDGEAPPLPDGDARPIIDFFGDEEAICTGYEIEYTPIDGAENSSFGWTHNPWGEGRTYVYDPSAPNDDYRKNVIPNLGDYSKKVFSFNMINAATGQGCGNNDGYFDDETGTFIDNILDYGYCPQKLIHWEKVEGRRWKYWWPRVTIFDGVSKIHNLKIKFSPNTVVIPKFWTGLKNCIEV